MFDPKSTNINKMRSHCIEIISNFTKYFQQFFITDAKTVKRLDSKNPIANIINTTIIIYVSTAIHYNPLTPL